MIANNKEFYGGLGMLIGFGVVLVLVFSPLFDGQNVLDYLDSLYNSISKGSAYYIPKVREEAGEFMGKTVSVTLKMDDEELARLNIEYRSKRASGRLGPVRPMVLAADELERAEVEIIRRRRGRSEQYKRQYLMTDVIADA